jgi:hypothetical protein
VFYQQYVLLKISGVQAIIIIFARPKFNVFIAMSLDAYIAGLKNIVKLVRTYKYLVIDYFIMDFIFYNQ